MDFGVGLILSVVAIVLVAISVAASLLVWRKRHGQPAPQSKQPAAADRPRSDDTNAEAGGLRGEEPNKADGGAALADAHDGGNNAGCGGEGTTQGLPEAAPHKQAASSAVAETNEPQLPPAGNDQRADKTDGPDSVEDAPGDARKTLKKRGAPPAAGMRQSQDPENYGGRKRGTGTDLGPVRHESRAEIVCQQGEWQWVLAVQVPEALAEKDGLRVLQGGQVLQRDDAAVDYWRLADTQRDVDLEWTDDADSGSDKVTLRDGEFLLFRLTGVGRCRGRLTRVPSCGGSYLAVVPETWTRDEARYGPAPVRDEATSLPGLRAHFFDLTESSREIAFHKPDGQSVVMRAKSPKFDLVGNRLRTVLQDQGPFFADGPPRVHVIDRDGWPNVGTIVIGEEGEGRGRWRTAFTPQAGQIEQDCPPELSARDAGWYFLRFYDTDGDLMESLDFRFANGLRDVAVDCEPLPSANRHSMGKVTIRHAADWRVECAAGNQQPLPISTDGDTTTIEVSPHPDCDRVRWRISSPQGISVEAVSPVGWLWWCLGEEGEVPERWDTCAVTLGLEDFRAASEKAAWIRLPAAGWTAEVRVGFADGAARPYQPKTASRDLVVALRDFTDAPELASPGTRDLRLWPRLGSQVIVLGRLVVPPPPPLPVPTKRCWKPVLAMVNKGCGTGGMKTGRGFSKRELRESGMRACDARRLCVPLDRRRKSGHALNADALRRLLSEYGKDGDKHA